MNLRGGDKDPVTLTGKNVKYYYFKYPYSVNTGDAGGRAGPRPNTLLGVHPSLLREKLRVET